MASYIILGTNEDSIKKYSHIDLVVDRLMEIVTLENKNIIRVILTDPSAKLRALPEVVIYSFDDDAKNLVSDDKLRFNRPTPQINKKLFPASLPPLLSLPTQTFLIIHDNIPEEVTMDQLQDRIKKITEKDAKTITIFDTTKKEVFTFSDKVIGFVNSSNEMLLPDFMKHLCVNYKMMIVTAENPNNPFELTKKYICEKTVLVHNNEYLEMDKYRVSQLTDEGGAFKYDGLFKGELVRIFYLRNDVIIGSLTNSGLFYKGVCKHSSLRENSETEQCRIAIGRYYNTIKSFKLKPVEQITELFKKTNYDTFLGNKNPLFFNFDIFKADNIINSPAIMVDIMLKMNELQLAIIFV